jgi:hypothetical protein
MDIKKLFKLDLLDLNNKKKLQNEHMKKILSESILPYRDKTYSELRQMIEQNVDAFEATDESGNSYNIEIEAFWDGKQGGNIRVVGCIDDDSFTKSISPLSDSFIKAPDESFVGE